MILCDAFASAEFRGTGCLAMGGARIGDGGLAASATNGAPRDRLGGETQDASAALSGCDVAGGDLVFVGGEGCQDFGLLALRDLEEVQGPSEFRCDLIEFCGGNPEFSVGLLKAERRRAGLGGSELEGPTRNVAYP
jgi:hypothetical protein